MRYKRCLCAFNKYNCSVRQFINSRGLKDGRCATNAVYAGSIPAESANSENHDKLKLVILIMVLGTI
jgi:hypothetical protein